MDCLILSPSSQLSITVKRSPAGMPVRARMSTKSMFETVKVPSCKGHMGLAEVEGPHALYKLVASAKHNLSKEVSCDCRQGQLAMSKTTPL